MPHVSTVRRSIMGFSSCAAQRCRARRRGQNINKNDSIYSGKWRCSSQDDSASLLVRGILHGATGGGASLICRLCWVSGRVQGVFYRGSAQATARKFGITGYARNLADGRVEVLACGKSDQLEAFIEWLKVGPVGASVLGVETVNHEPAAMPLGFTVA